MSALLNGSLLNGATQTQAWAWGRGYMEGSASSGAVNTVYTYVEGTSTAEAVSSAIPDRLAYLSADQIPYAEAAMTATRYAYVTGSSEASSQQFITPVRTAWFNASAATAQAVGEVTPVKWRLATGEAEVTALTAIDPLAAVRTSLMYNKRVPGQARSFVQEGDVSRFRVVQRWAKAESISRAYVRALPNTALGRGTASSTAVTHNPINTVSQTHNVSSTVSGECSAAVITSRIRITKSGIAGEAFTELAPTITRNGVSTSYFYGATQASANTLAINKVLRRDPGFLSISSDAETEHAIAYVRKGLSALSVGEADTISTPRFNNWKRVKAVNAGTATLQMTGVTVVTLGSLENVHGISESLGNQIVTSWMTGQSDAAAYSTVENSVATYMESTITAASMVTGKSNASNGVRVYGEPAEVSAESWAHGLRIVRYEDLTAVAEGAVFNLIYNINLDPTNEVVSSRSYIVPPSSRVYHVGSTDRRYNV